MKYSVSIDIERPLDEVIALFDNPENMKHWMEDLLSFEPLSGIPGEPGAKSRLVFQMGKRKMEMIESILVRDLPREFSGAYEAPGVYNEVRNFFESIGENKTRYTTEQEFHFKGMMKLMALLMPGAFKKQSYKYLESFKRFAESQKA